MIKVLVVDDSPVVQALLMHIFDGDPVLRVVGTAANGEEALRFLEHQQPDVITMDIHMAGMDGLEATRRIMETRPVPIVVVSSNTAPEEVEMIFRAIEAGAVAVLEKPRGPGHPQADAMARRLTQTVRAMAEVKVVRRWRKPAMPAIARTAIAPQAKAMPIAPPSTRKFDLVAIGISTGGPPVLQTILSRLPANFAAPILIVQHIAPGFLNGLVTWLQATSALPISIAQQGEKLLPGRVYMAPDGSHLGVARGCATLTKGDLEGNLRPAASVLFRSVVSECGPRAIGVLLTGMGRDGATELKAMKDAGALTIAQNEATCVVFGMPGEAVKLGAATLVLPPEQIAETLCAHVGIGL